MSDTICEGCQCDYCVEKAKHDEQMMLTLIEDHNRLIFYHKKIMARLVHHRDDRRTGGNHLFFKDNSVPIPPKSTTIIRPMPLQQEQPHQPTFLCRICQKEMVGEVDQQLTCTECRRPVVPYNFL
eukprot:g64062.t1